VAQDPVSTVAEWLTSPTGKSGDSNVPTDPILSMVAEYRWFLARAAEIRDRAEKIEDALPEAIERKPIVDKLLQAAPEDLRHRPREFFTPEFIESLPRLNAALEAAGVPALEKEAEDLERQSDEIRENIESTTAVSWDGVLAQLALAKEDMNDSDPESKVLDTIIAGVKHLRDQQHQTSVPGDEHPAPPATPAKATDPVIALIAEVQRLDALWIEASARGCAAHYDEAIADQVQPILVELRQTTPVTLAGAIAMLELGLSCGGVDEGLTNTALAGLRDMQQGGAA
jgi:hypothetical protein